ncbi:hypothetical protein [Alienimonas californiensis]|uniref:Uncharacterized protein n=1 Tax=Alienimonas californiensis TaxID=2527989 RepID=A0A517P8V3_9PLAN|nr:hypothetical protein [Alienimonas californiensis]QDT15797.1 hypothetical protein CA12_18910 [Alienimonas californiensis]
MSDRWLSPLSVSAAVALMGIWTAGLVVAYLQGERSGERPPGTRRRIVGGALGLSFASLPLLAPFLRDSAALVLAGTVVVTHQLAAGLTFSGTLAAWRAAERREPPAVAPPAVASGLEDGGGAAR